MPRLFSNTYNFTALTNRTITNAVTGQVITFLQTAADTHGHLLEMEAVYAAGSEEPAPHYHPKQTEYFKVVTGTLTIRIESKLLTLHQGELIKIEKGQVHSMWNAGTEPAVVNWKVRPALDTEIFLRTFNGLCNSGKADERGIPDIFQLSLTLPRFAHTIRLARPPFRLLMILFFLIKPLARCKGYKATYKEYLCR